MQALAKPKPPVLIGGGDRVIPHVAAGQGILTQMSLSLPKSPRVRGTLSAIATGLGDGWPGGGLPQSMLPQVTAPIAAHTPGGDGCVG